MILLLYGVLVCIWILGSFVRSGAAEWLFPLVLGAHVVAGLRLSWFGRRDLPSGKGATGPVLSLGGLALPPFAPLAFCILATGTTRRAALRRGRRDPLGRDLMAASRFWWGTGLAGVALTVVWFYGAFTALELRGSLDFHPWQDPLRVFPVLQAVVPRVLMLACGMWYLVLTWRTWTVMARHSRRPPAPRGEVPAREVVY